MPKIFRLPFAETLDQSLRKVGITDYDFGDDFSNEVEIDIDGLYSIHEIEFISPLSNEKEKWFLIGIQKFYPYFGQPKGTSYREIEYFLSDEIVDVKYCF